jgi:hypothetical protein
MKKFIIIEQVPALVEYTYEVEAENEDDALELVSSGLIDSVEYTVDTIYDSNVKLDFTRQVVEELDNDPNFVDSAGFSIEDRFEVFDEDDEEGSHHCDDPSCNCSI